MTPRAHPGFDPDFAVTQFTSILWARRLTQYARLRNATGEKMNIDNFKLRTKILIPVALMALVVVGTVEFSAVKLAAVSGAASEIIERRDMTAFQLARAGRFMFEAPYSAIGALFYDADSAAGRRRVPESGRRRRIGV